MSLKFSITTADFLQWDEMVVLTQKLERDKDTITALLIAIGSFTGLRISDILTLTWGHFIGKTHLYITEKKTKKKRTIKINPELSRTITRVFNQSRYSIDSLIVQNPTTKRALSVQHINRILKIIRLKYRLTIAHFSTHSLRKTFGRRIWESSGYSEKAITMLSEIFNHSSFRITRRYLGIKAEEIEQVYDLL